MQKIAIIGGGPAGVMAGIIASEEVEKQKAQIDVTIYDKSLPLKTLLYTGGGRCNLSYNEQDFRKIVKFFPRGEKFLLSIFFKFGVVDTRQFFKNIGINTYTQKDNRIFPVTDDAEDVRQALLKRVKQLDITFSQNEVTDIIKRGDGFIVKDAQSKESVYDKVVIATGGNRLKPKFSGYKIAESLGHKTTELRPALCGLTTKERWCCDVSGISLKNVKASIFLKNKKVKELEGDLLFTHRGISGPLAYKVSSYFAYENFDIQNPLVLELNLYNKTSSDLDAELIEKLNNNPHKTLLNTLSDYLPKSLVEVLLRVNGFDAEIKNKDINKVQRRNIVNLLSANRISIIDRAKEGEVVTAGGVDLKEVDGRAMESKIVKNLYFCGEVLDIDGLTGGFNLQACWSTGFVVGQNVGK